MGDIRTHIRRRLAGGWDAAGRDDGLFYPRVGAALTPG